MKALAMLWHEARLEQRMRNPGFYERYFIWVFKILHGWSNKKRQESSMSLVIEITGYIASLK